MKIDKYDLNCSDFDTIESWIDELKDLADAHNKTIKRYTAKKNLVAQYKKLHNKWWMVYILPFVIAITVAVILYTALVVIKNFQGFDLDTLFKIFLGVSVYVIALVALVNNKSYIPKDIDITNKDIDEYNYAATHLSDETGLLLYFMERFKFLSALKGFDKLYNTLEVLAKEKDLDVESFCDSILGNNKSEKD